MGVPDSEQDMLLALQQRAERYRIDISQVSDRDSLKAYPAELYQKIGMNKSQVNYDTIRQLLVGRIRERENERQAEIENQWKRFVTRTVEEYKKAAKRDAERHAVRNRNAGA